MNVRPAGREACNCASPYNSILERLDAMEAEILAVQATANSAMGVANAQAGAAASSASAAAASATAAGNAAISAAADASDALTQATASAGSADDAADSAADALTALQTIEGTIASVLASDIGGKVDKLTTAGFYLYMHNGSTQGEVQPVVAPTAATIPIRDSDGRMQAADPASGATDKTLVTANWVSQTGAGAPNNLLHTTGNETADGIKYFLDTIVGFNTGGNGRGSTGNANAFFRIPKYSSITLNVMVSSRYNVGMAWMEIGIDADDNVSVMSSAVNSAKTAGTVEAIVATTTDGYVRVGLRYTGSNVGADLHLLGVYANAGRPQPPIRETVSLTSSNLVSAAGVYVA